MQSLSIHQKTNQFFELKESLWKKKLWTAFSPLIQQSTANFHIRYYYFKRWILLFRYSQANKSEYNCRWRDGLFPTALKARPLPCHTGPRGRTPDSSRRQNEKEEVGRVFIVIFTGRPRQGGQVQDWQIWIISVGRVWDIKAMFRCFLPGCGEIHIERKWPEIWTKESI